MSKINKELKYTGICDDLEGWESYYFEGKTWIVTIRKKDLLNDKKFNGMIENTNSGRRFYSIYYNDSVVLYGMDRDEFNNGYKRTYMDNNLPIPKYIINFFENLYYKCNEDNQYLENLTIT